MLSFLDPKVFKLVGSLFALLDQDWVIEVKFQKLHFELHVMLSFLDPKVFNLVGSLLALSHQGQGFKYNLGVFRIVLPPTTSRFSKPRIVQYD